MKKALYIYLLLPYFSLAQTVWTGQVTDKLGEPLAFVNILLDGDPHDGVTSDIDGRFRIETNQDIEYLLFSYLGYENLSFSLSGNDPNAPLSIILKSTSFDLAEAVVVAGENPAHRIIRNVVKNRDRNNPEKLKSFTCETYNKFVFKMVPNQNAIEDHYEKKPPKNKVQKTRSDNLNKMSSNTEEFHALVWETITEKQFLFPEHRNEKVIYNRLSGLERPEFVALAQDMQPFSFYGDYLSLVDKDFLNPISPSSTSKYFFDIKDTLYQGRDSIFIISYHPRKGKKFEALKGLLYINTNQWAIQNVIAEPVEKTMMDIVFEQNYVWVEEGEHWFPDQLNFEVMMPKYPHKFMGMRVNGKSYIKNPTINPPLEKKSFNNLLYTLGDDAFNKADSVWNPHRVEQLDTKEIKTYERLDSIGQKINLDRKLDLLTAISTGKYPLGKLDIDLNRLLRSNEYEGTRLGLGLSTNKKVSPHFTLSAYGGYGFRDSTWKYGSTLKLHLAKAPQIDLIASYAKDLREPAIIEFPDLSGALINRAFYATQMDNIEKFSLDLETPLFKYAQLRIGMKRERLSPNYDYQFISTDGLPSNDFTFSSLGMSIRYSYGEQFIPLLGSKVPSGNNPHPVFQLSYEKGLKDWLGGQFDYDKILFGIEHQFKWRGLGESAFRIEAGWINNVLPYSKLFAGSGIGGGFQILSIDNNFQTMDLYEFLSDRFVHFFFAHNFGAFLYHSKYSKPEISVVQNMGVGYLTKVEPHQNIAIKTMEKGYLESGLVIDNLIRIPYINFAYIGLGAGIYYRYGAYAFSTLNENFAYRLTLDFTL